MPIIPVAPVEPTAPRPIAPQPFLLTDLGAIESLLTTGLLMPNVQRSAVQNAANQATRDLNSRLFRARTNGAGDVDGDGDVDAQDFQHWQGQFDSTMDSSMVRYLNFAASQNMDYRVALGLRDGIEVEYRNDSIALGDSLWASSPMALAGGPMLVSAAPAVTGAVIAAPAGQTGGKAVFEDKVVIENPAFKRFEVFSGFDYGFYDQDALTNLVRGFDSDTYAGTVGMEYRVFPWLHVGGAFTYLESNTDISSNLGSVDLDGTLLSGYATAFWRQFYVDALYSYGNFDNEVHRNTLLGRTARGDADSHSHHIDINVGYNHRLTDQITTGPLAGLNYTTGGIGGYTETGGANANLVYPDDNFESMIGRLGWQLSYTTNSPVGRLTAQGRAGWAHEFMPEADAVSASLQNSPFILVNGNHASRVGGFAAQGNGAHAGQDWLELGAGLRLDLDESWNLQLDYEGQFARNNASAHFAAIKLEYEWGDVFLPGMGGGKGVVAESSADDDAMAGAIATAVSPSKNGSGKGLKGLFAGKSKRAAATMSLGNRSAEVGTPAGMDAGGSEPFAAAKPAGSSAPKAKDDGTMTPAALPKASGSGEPVIYDSWDQVPGRAKVTGDPSSASHSKPVASPVEEPRQKAKSDEPVAGKPEPQPKEEAPTVATGEVAAAQ